MIFSYVYNGETVQIDLAPQPDGGYTATIGDQQFKVDAQALDSGWTLTINGERVMIHTASQGNTRFVQAGGESYTLTVLDARTRRRGGAGAGGDLTAQMPGQVVGVLVSAGDVVERGQALVILEAMKMEIRVAAPAAGTVRRVLVNKGDVVERGQRLVEIE